MANESPSSFATPTEGDPTILTPPSTAQASRASTVPPSNAPPPRYRSAAQLPYALTHHCSVYLGSGQYSQGFSLLSSLIRSGTLSHNQPAQIPPTQLFELAATLAVHPALTTRASTPEKLQAANAAVRYLRDVNRIIGPVNAGFLHAFTFPGPGSTRLRGRTRGASSSPANSRSTRVEDDRPIKSPLATHNGLWAKADDFWHVVGWAFNCSVKEKARWSRWKIWLELMLEIMEDDWNERLRLTEEHGGEAAVDNEVMLQSIIAQHLVSANASSLSARRRIVRAILADGGTKAANEFREVFKDELKERNQERELQPIKEVNFEEGKFGDLEADPDEEDMNDPGSPASARKSGRNFFGRRSSVTSISSGGSGSSGSTDDYIHDETISPTDQLGGVDAIRLRQRLLAFLATVAEALPRHFTSREQLFDTYTEYLRPLLTPVFAVLIRTSLLPAASQCILAANTLLVLLPNSPPTYNFIPPSQDEWEEYFFPYAANSHSYADNAKVSILLQQVIQSTMSEITWKRSWVDSVFKGIQARRKKATGQHKGRGGLIAREIPAQKMLKETEQCLLLLIDCVEDDANAPPAERSERIVLPRPRKLVLVHSPKKERHKPMPDTDTESDLSPVPTDLEDVDMDI